MALGPAGCRASETAAAAEVLSLPIYPELADDEVAHIADAIRRCFVSTEFALTVSCSGHCSRDRYSIRENMFRSAKIICYGFSD